VAGRKKGNHRKRGGKGSKSQTNTVKPFAAASKKGGALKKTNREKKNFANQKSGRRGQEEKEKADEQPLDTQRTRKERGIHTEGGKRQAVGKKEFRVKKFQSLGPAPSKESV